VNLERPFGVVTPTLDGAVLQALLTVDHLESGAEIHRRCGLGSAQFYRLERRHISYGAIVALGAAQDVLVERIREQLSTVAGLSHASLVGREPLTVLLVARDDTVLSGGVWRYELGQLDSWLSIWTGSQPRLRQHALADIRLRIHRSDSGQDDPELAAWRQRHVHLAGAELSELAHEA
jgi:hypothetical protein